MMDALTPLAFENRPFIGFRVEVNNPSNPRDHNANGLRARDPSAQPTLELVREHLTWSRRQPGPFVSFFTTWSKALRRRQYFLGRGAREIIIHAVWLRDLPDVSVYDACEAAERVGLEDWPFSQDEVLVLDRRPSSRWQEESALEKYRLFTLAGARALTSVLCDFHGVSCFRVTLPVGRTSREDLDAATRGICGRHETAVDLGLLRVRYPNNACDMYWQTNMRLPCDVDGNWTMGGYPSRMKQDILAMILGRREFAVSWSQYFIIPHSWTSGNFELSWTWMATVTDFRSGKRIDYGVPM